MVLALALTLLVIWWLLWAMFHLAGGPVHLLLAAGLLTMVWRVVRCSCLRPDLAPQSDQRERLGGRQP